MSAFTQPGQAGYGLGMKNNRNLLKKHGKKFPEMFYGKTNISGAL